MRTVVVSLVSAMLLACTGAPGDGSDGWVSVAGGKADDGTEVAVVDEAGQLVDLDVEAINPELGAILSYDEDEPEPAAIGDALLLLTDEPAEDQGDGVASTSEEIAIVPVLVIGAVVVGGVAVWTNWPKIMRKLRSMGLADPDISRYKESLERTKTKVEDDCAKNPEDCRGKRIVIAPSAPRGHGR